ncbi:MAG: purine-nucleoside phosphorylase [Elusimicrobia bacterium]|nr:purine-nucleoside phosphorylase [Elusimicrobiota bacterium]
MENSQVKRVFEIVAWLKKHIGSRKPSAAIIMGSGLSEAVPEMKNMLAIPYSDIPGFLRSTVEGHAGRLLFGEIGGREVAVMQGRFHYYEGHSISDIAIPIRTLWKLGAEALIITSAVGSLNKSLKLGNLAILKDHINFMGINPLRGIYDPAFGKMFVDMSQAYDKVLRNKTLKLCKKLKIPAREAVYIAIVGPSYETPSEIKTFRNWGADVVGMSVAPEVIAARQLGMKVLGISWVTNMASGISKTPITHEDVLEQSERAARNVKALLTKALKD